MALAAAKAYTRRRKIVVFAGAYHGGAFAFARGESSPVNVPHEYVRRSLHGVLFVSDQVEGSALRAMLLAWLG